MASINISVTREIYDKLRHMKLPEESFSSVIGRLIDLKKNPFEFEGIWENWGFADDFSEGIIRARENDCKKDSDIIQK